MHDNKGGIFLLHDGFAAQASFEIEGLEMFLLGRLRRGLVKLVLIWEFLCQNLYLPDWLKSASNSHSEG